MDVDPVKNRKDIKKKDKRARELSKKYSASNLADSLVRHPAGKGSKTNALKRLRSQSMQGFEYQGVQGLMDARTEFSFPDGDLKQAPYGYKDEMPMSESFDERSLV